MIHILSIVTSFKDYLDVVHKLVEYDASSTNINYENLGNIITYLGIAFKNGFGDLISFTYNLPSIPVIVPNISSAMISEVSVLKPLLAQNTVQSIHTVSTSSSLTLNIIDTFKSPESINLIMGLEKLTIGVLNSIFLCLPTSTTHIIILRRFVMQGLEAGYMAGLGTIAGNLLWLTSVLLGWRFFVIPWVSLDIFRYVLGVVLLVKYMCDCCGQGDGQKRHENKTPLNLLNKNGIDLVDTGEKKIFFLNFILALTEQTSIYPFTSNLSLSADASIIESFPVQSIAQFWWLHTLYLLGIGIGSFSLLQLTCWLLEKLSKLNSVELTGFTMISSVKNLVNKITTYINANTILSPDIGEAVVYMDRLGRSSVGSEKNRLKILNFTFLYLTMTSAITSIPYYGVDYTITNPLGYVNEDRLSNVQDKQVLFSPSTSVASFLGTKASDRNTRRNTGRRGRRERWKRRIRKFRTFDASLYDQGVYDLFTVEDLNYGFDRFWLRRKLRNHNVKFKLFPGPLMRTLKKQLLKPKSNSPSVDFFRILFEQAFTNTFFARKKTRATSTPLQQSIGFMSGSSVNRGSTLYGDDTHGNSTLRKFVRKVDNRLKHVSQFAPTGDLVNSTTLNLQSSTRLHFKNYKNVLRLYKQQKKIKNNTKLSIGNNGIDFVDPNSANYLLFLKNKIKNVSTSSILSSEDRQSRSKIKNNINYNDSKITNQNNNETNKKSLSLLHPLKFYQRREAAFERKLRYYTPSVFRKFSVENNAPHFRVMMRRFFYNYKPTLRWERTMKLASLRKARRKTTRTPRVLEYTHTDVRPVQTSDSLSLSRLHKPTHSYSAVRSARTSRYRFQIYKDVMQHWYYSPFNRFLLKMDVDGFIRRQPHLHFLSAAEENLLHLRRFLLAEHHNTLRWYSNMEHYRLMKDKLGGGTKSFSSRVYNQQFAGTLKKIRHLFFVTPQQQNNVLKYDQPLYNEYTSGNAKAIVLHEELNKLTESYADLLDASTLVLSPQATLLRDADVRRDYATRARLITRLSTKSILSNKYTNTVDANKTKNDVFSSNGSIIDLVDPHNNNNNVYVTHLKNWKREVADLEALKHYSSRNHKRVLNGTKKVLSQLEHFAGNPVSVGSNTVDAFSGKARFDYKKITLTSGLQKAIIDSVDPHSHVSTNALSGGDNNKHLQNEADQIKLNFNKSLRSTDKTKNSVPTKLLNIYASLVRTAVSLVNITAFDSNKNTVKTKNYMSQKERARSKQKRLRKELKLLNKQQPLTANSLQNLNNTFVTSIARKKRENDENNNVLISEALKLLQYNYKKEPAAPRNKNGRYNYGVYRKRVSDTTKVQNATHGQQLFLDDKKTKITTPVTKTTSRNEKRSQNKLDMKRQKYRKKRRTTLGKIRRESKQAYKKQVSRNAPTIQSVNNELFKTYIGTTRKLKHKVSTSSILTTLEQKTSEDRLSRYKTVNKLLENLLTKADYSDTNKVDKREMTTNLPFYAGWDELGRRFVVTNRLLSRQDAGYTMTNNVDTEYRRSEDRRSLANNNNEITFTKAPLKGMNAATTLYWQTPFTTYDPDQYFSLGLDGFSPISWRKFLFRHSVLKNALMYRQSRYLLKNDLVNVTPSNIHENSNKAVSEDRRSRYNYVFMVAQYSRNEVAATKSSLFKNINSNKINGVDTKTKISRHLKKRYRRVKKHPRTPVTFPSGALINQVLPVQYIYVFYKRSRLPSDRYLIRRLVNRNEFKVKDSILKLNNTDFTLRKRLKPEREYHSVREVQKTVNPRRLRLLATTEISWNHPNNNMLANKKIKRPVSGYKSAVKNDKEYIRGIVKEQKAQRIKKTQQLNTKKADTQLKRRVLQTTLRTVWRYRPRAGGFIWPGYYSLLELVEAPLLASSKNGLANAGTDVNSDKDRLGRSSQNTIKIKKKRELFDWQGQPKKYLYEKHNLKVLKKKLKNK